MDAEQTPDTANEGARQVEEDEEERRQRMMLLYDDDDDDDETTGVTGSTEFVIKRESAASLDPVTGDGKEHFRDEDAASTASPSQEIGNTAAAAAAISRREETDHYAPGRKKLALPRASGSTRSAETGTGVRSRSESANGVTRPTTTASTGRGIANGENLSSSSSLSSAKKPSVVVAAAAAPPAKRPSVPKFQARPVPVTRPPPPPVHSFSSKIHEIMKDLNATKERADVAERRLARYENDFDTLKKVILVFAENCDEREDLLKMLRDYGIGTTENVPIDEGLTFRSLIQDFAHRILIKHDLDMDATINSSRVPDVALDSAVTLPSHNRKTPHPTFPLRVAQMLASLRPRSAKLKPQIRKFHAATAKSRKASFKHQRLYAPQGIRPETAPAVIFNDEITSGFGSSTSIGSIGTSRAKAQSSRDFSSMSHLFGSQRSGRPRSSRRRGDRPRTPAAVRTAMFKTKKDDVVGGRRNWLHAPRILLELDRMNKLLRKSAAASATARESDQKAVVLPNSGQDVNVDPKSMRASSGSNPEKKDPVRSKEGTTSGATVTGEHTASPITQIAATSETKKEAANTNTTAGPSHQNGAITFQNYPSGETEAIFSNPPRPWTTATSKFTADFLPGTRPPSRAVANATSIPSYFPSHMPASRQGERISHSSRRAAVKSSTDAAAITALQEKLELCSKALQECMVALAEEQRHSEHWQRRFRGEKSRVDRFESEKEQAHIKEIKEKKAVAHCLSNALNHDIGTFAGTSKSHHEAATFGFGNGFPPVRNVQDLQQKNNPLHEDHLLPHHHSTLPDDLFPDGNGNHKSHLGSARIHAHHNDAKPILPTTITGPHSSTTTRSRISVTPEFDVTEPTTHFSRSARTAESRTSRNSTYKCPAIQTPSPFENTAGGVTFKTGKRKTVGFTSAALRRGRASGAAVSGKEFATSSALNATIPAPHSRHHSGASSNITALMAPYIHMNGVG